MVQNNQNAEVYFHVGLGKVASSYLQYKVFPKLKGVHYVQRTKYKKYKKILSENKYNKYLFSREFDRQLEDEVRKFSELYPDAKIIIILRRHDSWIASQYRRQVKNGKAITFKEFIDIEHNKGVWNNEVLYFFPKIQFIEKHMNHKPLVLFYDDLKMDSYRFINQITDFIGATYDPGRISLAPKHRSYNEKQLKVIQKVSKYIFIKDQKKARNLYNKKTLLKRRYLSYFIMFFALFIPNSLISKESLIPQEQLDEIRKFYSDDWEKCLEYAKKNN